MHPPHSSNGVYSLLEGAMHHGKIVYDGTGEELREYIHVKVITVLRNKIVWCHMIVKFRIMIFVLHRNRFMEFTILRYGSLYGTRSTSSNGVYSLLEGAMHHGKIV